MLTDIESLITELNTAIGNRKGAIIGIDGCDGVGKTTLGRNIAKLLKMKHLDLDAYIIEKSDNFLNNICDKRLKADIESLKKESLIISGICLLEILERNQINPDILIYVKKYDNSGMLWRDEDDCTIQGDPYELLENRVRNYNKIMGKEGGFDPKDYRYEADKILYHQKYKPHEKADIIFMRKEGDV